MHVPHTNRTGDLSPVSLRGLYSGKSHVCKKPLCKQRPKHQGKGGAAMPIWARAKRKERR